MKKEKLSRSEKRLRKEEKWNDPLGIDKMSDEEFLEKLPELERRVGGNGIVGGLLFVAGFILLALLWDGIFWS